MKPGPPSDEYLLREAALLRALRLALEGQIVDWLRTFQPDDDLQTVVLDAIRATTRNGDNDLDSGRRELTSQLQRLRDLYVMGDLTKPQYVMRRQALEDELERTGSPADPPSTSRRAPGRLRALLGIEPSATERRKLLASLFERIWAHEGTITAVEPRGLLATLLPGRSNVPRCRKRERRRSNPPMTPASRSGSSAA